MSHPKFSGLKGFSVNPYPTSSERKEQKEQGQRQRQRRDNKDKSGNKDKGECGIVREEETIEAIVEKAQKAQLGLDEPVVLLDSPKVVKAMSNFLFEDPFWNAHFGTILESYHHKSGNNKSGKNNTNNSVMNTA
jgi:hypothetical protein